MNAETQINTASEQIIAAATQQTLAVEASLNVIIEDAFKLKIVPLCVAVALARSMIRVAATVAASQRFGETQLKAMIDNLVNGTFGDMQKGYADFLASQKVGES